MDSGVRVLEFREARNQLMAKPMNGLNIGRSYSISDPIEMKKQNCENCVTVM